MSSCSSIDPLVTPYVDCELDQGARDAVEAHLQSCAVCRARIAAERAACALVKRRQAELTGVCAPSWLRDRCAGTRRSSPVVPLTPRTEAPPARRAGANHPVVRWALAATVLLASAGALVYRVTVGAEHAIAAELAADHAKCFMLNTVLRTHQSIGEAQAYLRSRFDWEAELPQPAGDTDLHLVGSRPCLYERGMVAHLMYRHHGVPVSIFMLPGVRHEPNTLHAFGHDAVIWTRSGRTFVLIAKAPPEQIHEVATLVKASLH